MQAASTQSEALAFTVIGIAKPAGSKKAFVINGKARITDASNNKSWRQEVSQAGANAMNGAPLLLGALEVGMTFIRPRPKGHYGTGRNAGVLRTSAPVWPTTKPDVLKLARLVEDALTGVVWRDDAQIAVEMLFKTYGEPERVEIHVRELGIESFGQGVDFGL